MAARTDLLRQGGVTQRIGVAWKFLLAALASSHVEGPLRTLINWGRRDMGMPFTKGPHVAT